MGEPIVRRCGAEDWRGLRAIRLESLADTPEAYGSTYADALTWTDERWQTRAWQWTYFLGERDGHAVGMASGGLNDGHPGTRWLYGMYVTPAQRGSGVADLLVDAVSQWAIDEGVSQLHLQVTTSVERACAFYQKVGFRPTGEIVFMDRDPSLTLATMVKDLG